MSLTFRRVTKISKRTRKSKSKTRHLEKPSINDTTYLENFPSLNTIYKSDIFGTPIKYHFSCGSDQTCNVKYRVKCHVLVFMEEYRDKSVEELRWEDYQCNRKGRQVFEERNYLRRLCSNSEHAGDDSLASETANRAGPDVIPTSFEASFDSDQELSKDRCSTEQPDPIPVNESLDLPSPSDPISRQEQIQIVKNNLVRFFENAEPDASVPYDFLPQNTKFYLPCADVKFVYQNARPSLSLLKAGEISCADSQTSLDMYEGLLEKKYTLDNRFCKDYFWKKINPYASDAVPLGICRGLQLRNSFDENRMPVDGAAASPESGHRLPRHHHNHHNHNNHLAHNHAYDLEYAQMEAWLDEHPDFANDYFLRKATRHVVEQWQVSHATPTSSSVEQLFSPPQTTSGSGSGAATPVRKISAHEFERGGLLKPMINTVDGQPTFLTNEVQAAGAGGAGSPTPARRHRRSRHELRQMDEKDLIFELVKDICNELEVRSLCHKILQNVCVLLNADRGSLFLVQGEKVSGGCPVSSDVSHGQRDRCLVSKLFDVCSKSTLIEMEKKEEIKIPLGTGIVGYVAESGEAVNIPDAYEDDRFNHEVDSRTGYRTKSLLCMPIKDTNGDVIGVAQVINKIGDQPFTKADEEVFSKYLQFCGIGLRNAHLYEKSQLEIRRNQVLLDLARMIFQEQSTLEHVVYRILLHTQSLIQCQRVQILLTHQDSSASFSRVFDFEENDVNIIESGESRTSPLEGRFPINLGITGHVATTGETVNLVDVYEDERFDPEVDHNTAFRHETVLCMPIKNSRNRIIGIIQLINKFDHLPFTKNDENFVEAFAIFCGMGIHNTRMYEDATAAMAKQKVILEVLSYHATASAEEAQKLRVSPKALRIPSNAKFKLLRFDFDDINMKDDETLSACLRMFLDLDLVERFHIDYDVLCRWLLSVKKNYRDVTYHNWRHAFNVGQMMYSILLATRWWEHFGTIECLALMIACLCHDLDHRGTNNSFQIKIHSPIAQLYSTSTMEHHHFDQCLMILNSLQLLSELTNEEHSRVIRVLEDAILATDLAIYFKNRVEFFKIANVGINWKKEDHRESVRGMLMTVCDLAAITKPWEVEKRIADLVTAEFFEQGDLEREKLNITPMDIMDRTKAEQLPVMQINFIDSICLPVYEAFADLSDSLNPLLEGVKQNREHWLEEAQKAHLVPDVEEEENHKDDNDNVSKSTSPDQSPSEGVD